MLDRPPLEDHAIAACLAETYGVTPSGITFLPIGYDSQAGAFRVESGVQRYFLKVRHGAPPQLSILLPRYLSAQGIRGLVPPLPTTTGALWGQVGTFALLLYPFVESAGDAAARMSDAHWVEFGAVMRQIHTLRLSPALRARLPQETFTPMPASAAAFDQVHALVQARTFDNASAEQFAAFWRAHRADLDHIRARAAALGEALRGRAADWVLCHADIHAGNLMLDTEGRLFIVDWDQPVLSLIERDLMFLTAGGFAPGQRQTALFFEGYGSAALDKRALAYFCYARLVEDVGEFGRSALLLEGSDATRESSLYWFRQTLAPGSLADTAAALDIDL